MTCQHINFQVGTQVTLIEDKPGVRMLDIKMRCADCGKPFEFVGPPVGVNYYRPTVSLDGQIMTVPIVPEGEKQPEGLPYLAARVTVGGN